jgi:hypothetical protein
MRELDVVGFLWSLPKRLGMVHNLRHLFQRGNVTEQELRILHGVITEKAAGAGRAGLGPNRARARRFGVEPHRDPTSKAIQSRERALNASVPSIGLAIASSRNARR